MTDEQLIAACRELHELREQLRQLTAREKLVALDVLDQLTRRGVDFFVFEPDQRLRAVRETPETREVNEPRFLAACRELELEADAIAACYSRRISVAAARKLLDGEVAFDRICDVRLGAPRVRVVGVE